MKDGFFVNPKEDIKIGNTVVSALGGCLEDSCAPWYSLPRDMHED